MRGLGCLGCLGQDDDDDGGTLSDIPLPTVEPSYSLPGLDTTFTPPSSVPTGNSVICSDGTILPGGQGTCPSGASVYYGSSGAPATTGLSQSEMNSLINGGMSIAKILALEQAPAGTSINAAAGTVTNFGSAISSALSGSIGGIPISMLLILGVAAVFLMNMEKH
jgi:hypothetical protein